MLWGSPSSLWRGSHEKEPKFSLHCPGWDPRANSTKTPIWVYHLEVGPPISTELPQLKPHRAETSWVLSRAETSWVLSKLLIHEKNKWLLFSQATKLWVLRYTVTTFVWSKEVSQENMKHEYRYCFSQLCSAMVLCQVHGESLASSVGILCLHNLSFIALALGSFIYYFEILLGKVSVYPLLFNKLTHKLVAPQNLWPVLWKKQTKNTKKANVKEWGIIPN